MKFIGLRNSLDWGEESGGSISQVILRPCFHFMRSVGSQKKSR